MTIATHIVEPAANLLLNAEASAETIDQLTRRWPDLDIDTAYAIQDATLNKRVARGERCVGIKLGLTSRAKQVRMGIDQPTVSWLTDAMLLPTYEQVDLTGFIHPRAEPEIAFITASRLQGPGLTAHDALAAVGAAHAAIEVIDSRYRDFAFRLADTVADNSSSGGFLLGPVGVDPRSVDLLFEAVLLEADGVVVDSATGAAVYGHPAEALAWAVNQLSVRGLDLPAGSIVLTGGMSDAIALGPLKTVSARFTNLGSLNLRIDTTQDAS